MRTLTITLSGPTTQDVDLIVLDSSGTTPLAFSANLDSSESLTVNLAAGTYLVVAYPADVTAPAAYTIYIP
jgi:hypothetical protein